MIFPMWSETEHLYLAMPIELAICGALVFIWIGLILGIWFGRKDIRMNYAEGWSPGE